MLTSYVNFNDLLKINYKILKELKCNEVMSNSLRLSKLNNQINS